MTANMKPPSGRKAVWPPKGFAYAQAVHYPSGMNWWSLAWAVGRDNPWDLIIYNFETENPREVNWYLQDKGYVGCKKLDGSNYVFAGAKPGIVYIPPASWRPPTKYKKGSSRRNYSNYITKRIASIIRKAAYVCPWITGFGYAITPFDLLMVAKSVESGKIHCHVAPEVQLANALAIYFTGDVGDFRGNSFYFSREPHSGSLDVVATVVHESVHAAFDARKVKDMYKSSNEMIAYAVESIITARLFPKEVERRLSLASSSGYKSIHKDHKFLFFGWALKKRAFVDLLQIKGEPDVEDPFMGTNESLYANLYRYVYAREKENWRKKTINDGL